MRISGAAAIVTGGGSGLGRATAEALAAKGAKVAVADLNAAAAEEVARAIGGVAVVCDVANDASAVEAFAKAEAAHGAAKSSSIAPASAIRSASSARTEARRRSATSKRSSAST